jgi:predicted CXXCH cytochrome family protein
MGTPGGNEHTGRRVGEMLATPTPVGVCGEEPEPKMTTSRKFATLLGVAIVAASLVAGVLPVAAQEGEEYAPQKMCEVCHKLPQADGEVAPVTDLYMETKHAKAEGDGPRYTAPDEEAGVGCQACHGAGQKHVMEHGAPEFIHNPEDIEEREGRFSLCGRCHALYEEEWVEEYTFGDNILEDITLLDATGEKLQQLNEMKDSSHFTDSTAPTCINCHTGHKELSEELPHQIRKPINELCLECHADQEDYAHSGWDEIPDDATCSTCHMPNKKHVFVAPESADAL